MKYDTISTVRIGGFEHPDNFLQVLHNNRDARSTRNYSIHHVCSIVPDTIPVYAANQSTGDFSICLVCASIRYKWHMQATWRLGKVSRQVLCILCNSVFASLVHHMPKNMNERSG